MPEHSPAVITRDGLEFKDKVVIITGGAKGIGAACVRVFVDAGARAVFFDLDKDAGRALESEVNQQGPGACRFVEGDVRNRRDLERLVETAVHQFDRIDCMLNNAGYHPPLKRVDGFTEEEFLDVLRVNLISQFILCQLTLPHLRKSKGSIINISSLVGELGQEGATTYAATKGGVTAFTKALAIDEATTGVRVNAILPGNIVSHGRIVAVAEHSRPKELDAWCDSNQPNNRSGTTEEVAQACLFLASGLASYISGVALNLSYGAELGFGPKFPSFFFDGDRLRN
jgi:NAD(P)-dependent dehydrogenase (short-subunit alcohol dehydrogenase family)